jgi:Uma2 family endonuclease
VATPVQIEKLTLEKFSELYEQEGPFEILHGERTPLMPPVAQHGILAKRLVRFLARAEDEGLGEVFFEMPYVLLDTSNWVRGARVPDVMFFLAERLNQYRAATPNHKTKPFVLVPDLAVEIISPNDLYGDVDEKVSVYLKDGVQMVWVVNPRQKGVVVHQAHTNQQLRLTVDDSLSTEPVIPVFEISVAQLFE